MIKIIEITSIKALKGKTGKSFYSINDELTFFPEVFGVLEDAHNNRYSVEVEVVEQGKFKNIRSAKKTDKVVETVGKPVANPYPTIPIDRGLQVKDKDKERTAVMLTSYAKDMWVSKPGDDALGVYSEAIAEAYKKILESI